MQGVEYSLDKTQQRIASNLQINYCCRHFSAVRTSCFLLKYQVPSDAERFSCDIFVISLRTSFWKCYDVCCPTLFPL